MRGENKGGYTVTRTLRTLSLTHTQAHAYMHTPAHSRAHAHAQGRPHAEEAAMGNAPATPGGGRPGSWRGLDGSSARPTDPGPALQPLGEGLSCFKSLLASGTLLCSPREQLPLTLTLAHLSGGGRGSAGVTWDPEVAGGGRAWTGWGRVWPGCLDKQTVRSASVSEDGPAGPGLTAHRGRPASGEGRWPVLQRCPAMRSSSEAPDRRVSRGPGSLSGEGRGGVCGCSPCGTRGSEAIPRSPGAWRSLRGWH